MSKENRRLLQRISELESALEDKTNYINALLKQKNISPEWAWVKEPAAKIRSGEK